VINPAHVARDASSTSLLDARDTAPMTTEASVRVIASVDADAGADADASAKGTKTIPHDASTRDVDADEKVSDEESDEAKAIEHASEGAEDGRRRARSSVSDDSRERTVFIGGTSHESDEDAVRAHFEKNFGPVESVKLIYDRQTMARKGYGFVKFFDVDVARKVKTGEVGDRREGGGREGGHSGRASGWASSARFEALERWFQRLSERSRGENIHWGGWSTASQERSGRSGGSTGIKGDREGGDTGEQPELRRFYG
jgi:hypothetical protein